MATGPVATGPRPDTRGAAIASNRRRRRPGSAVVVGGGHNGLVAACYLARAGVDVTVLEQSERAGGGSRTDETLPGYRFNTHSAAHNILNMTEIPGELDLPGAGLRYVQMEPFATGVFADGRVVRFHRDVAATVDSIAEHDPAEARRYRDLMDRALPLVDVATAGLRRPGSVLAGAAAAVTRVGRLARAVRRFGGVADLAQDVLGPYGSLLEGALGSDLTRAPVAAFAAHSSAGPDGGGGGFFALWQAAYHRHGQWQALGGSGALTDALLARLREAGGRVVTGAAAQRIEVRAGRVGAVVTAGGDRHDGDVVVAALDPRVALLDLLSPALSGPVADRLRARHRSNTVQLVVHLATTALPPYRSSRPGDWNGLQSHVPTLAALSQAFAEAAAGVLPSRPPTYAFTPTAADPALAPPGRHTVYLACPAAPARVDGGWDAHAEAFADAMVAEVERCAPGFTDTVVARHVRTPAAMEAELAWPGAHPMALDVTVDQLGPLRPVPALARHRTPVPGLYVCGAGVAPVGGIAGVPGKAAALAALRHG